MAIWVILFEWIKFHTWTWNNTEDYTEFCSLADVDESFSTLAYHRKDTRDSRERANLRPFRATKWRQVRRIHDGHRSPLGIELESHDFDLILAKLAYAINQRPLTPMSNDNNDLDFISPASFLKTPIADQGGNTFNNFDTW